MESTSIIALSRQSVLRRQMTNVANNIANMNTGAFKGEKMMFVEHMVRSKGGDGLISDKVSYVRDLAQVIDFREGPIKGTGNPLDLALHGDGFFVVETEDGPRYTRNGRFQIDPEGQMVTQTGEPVLTDGGAPVYFAPNENQIQIARDGTVSTENGVIGRLDVVTFDNLQALEKQAGSLFAAPDDMPAKPAEKPDVRQGALEGSNIEPILEMTRMIEVSRSYNSAKKLVEKEDERLKKVLGLIKTSG